MRIGTRTLDAKQITLNSTGKKTIEIPKNNYIRKISMKLDLNLTTTTAPAANALLQIIDNMRIVGNGKDAFKDVNFERYWRHKQIDFGTAFSADAAPSTNETAVTKRVSIVFPFSLNPGNPYDLSALLPAHLMSSLDMIFNVQTVANLTVNSGSIAEITIEEIFLSPQEENDLFGSGRERLVHFYEAEVSKTIDGATTDYKLERDLPVGMVIRKMGMFTYSGTTLTDNIVTSYRIKQNSPFVNEVLHSEWFASKYEDKLRYALESLQTGYTVIDFESKDNGGFDARGLKGGDVVLQCTTSAAGSIVLLCEEFA